MHLYLRSAGIVTELPEISLLDGYMPTIGDASILCLIKGGENLTEIESAVWFKVLVVDSVSIDCDRRAISWSTINDVDVDHIEVVQCPLHSKDTTSTPHKPPSPGHRKQVSQLLYADGESCGFLGDIDEVFDVTHDVLTKYAFGDSAQSSFYCTMMKLLHSYILPSVRFTVDDLGRVRNGLKSQENAVQKVDELLVTKDNQVEGIRKALQNQRNHFVELLTEDETPCLPISFMRVLACDINKEIVKCDELINQAQFEVDFAKRLDSNDEQSAKKLAECRKQRDVIVKDHERLLLARENLREIIDHEESTLSKFSPSIRKKSLVELEGCEPNLALCNVYLGMHKVLEEFTKEAIEITKKKILMVSVREALCQTVRELESGVESFGVDMDKSGLRKATDVLNASLPASWYTLTEQVAALLMSDCELSDMHTKFCLQIKQQCSDALEEKQVLQSSVEDRGSSGNTAALVAENKGYRMQRKRTVAHENESHMVSSSYSASSNGSAVSSEGNSTFYTPCELTRESVNTLDLLSVDELDFDNTKLSFNSNHNPQTQKRCFPLLPKFLSSSKYETLPYGISDSLDEDDACPDVDESSVSKLVELPASSCIGDDIVVVYDAQTNYVRKHISVIQKAIEAHFNEIVQLVQYSLKLEDVAYFRKIWLCYESCFYQETMKDLMELYEAEYSPVIQSMIRKIPQFSLKDMNLEESAFCHMLHGGRNSRTKYYSKYPKPRQSTLPSGPDSDSIELQHMAADLAAGTRKTSGENGIRKIMRFFSDTSPDCAPETEAPRTITVYHPTCVTMIYDRRTWPVRRTLPDFESSLEAGEDALEQESLQENTLGKDLETSVEMRASSVNKRSKSHTSAHELCFLPKYQEKFSEANASVKQAVEEQRPLYKLQHLTRCLRELSSQVTSDQQELSTYCEAPGSDCLVDMILLLLCNLDADISGKLYAHLMLLNDVIPPFFAAGPFSFTLVQFTVAFQFIQDRIVILTKKMASGETFV